MLQYRNVAKPGNTKTFNMKNSFDFSLDFLNSHLCVDKLKCMLSKNLLTNS